jgi:hypothetical protein
MLKTKFLEQPCPNPELEGPCLIWQGAKDAKGYGKTGFVINGIKKNWMVHRLEWTKKNGPIPDGLMIDHRCRNRACANPLHLRLVTSRQNALENNIGGKAAINAAKTHCYRGHEFTPENTRRDKNGDRQCRTCYLANERARDKRKRQRKNASQLFSGKHLLKTHCPAGHLYDWRGSWKGKRKCYQCHLLYKQRVRAERRAAQ